MMLSDANKVTRLAHYRAVRAAPVNDACRWSAALEEVAAANLRLAFALQRVWWRAVSGA